VRFFEPKPGAVLGKYELLAPVAKGGMAQVWSARPVGSRGFRNVVAIKTILKGQLDDRRLEQMFLREGAVAARVQHPNVVKTFEAGEHDGVLYLTMEWVDGEPLHVITAEAREHGGIPIPISVYLVSQVLRGLHAAHDLVDDDGALMNLVHRDISPQNVMVTSTGAVKLVDFGIAKTAFHGDSLTEVGEIKGKFAYVSPEQVTGAALDRRSDVFAAGVLLYMLTTGRHPFKGENAAETVSKICSGVPALPPSRARVRFPPELERVLLKALEKQTEQRWATAEEMAVALEAAVPECSKPEFQKQVGDYVHQLCGSRSAERRQQLRIAEERLERERNEGSSPMLAAISQGSLRALSIERNGTEIVIHAEADASFDTLSLDIPERESTSPIKRRLRSALWSAVLLVSGALVGLGARSLMPRPEAPGRSASPVPSAVFEAGRVRALNDPQGQASGIRHSNRSTSTGVSPAPSGSTKPIQ
jgi:serine/threonine protein kinase